MKPFETIEINEHVKIELHLDDSPEDPREFMAGQWYTVGRDGDFRSEDTLFDHIANKYNSNFAEYYGADRDDHREALLKKNFVIDYASTRYRDNYCVLDAATIEDEWNGDKEAAKRYAEIACETVRAWADGECYGFITKIDGEHTDSCWGFYSTEEAAAAAKENLPTIDEQYHFDRAEALSA